MNLIDRIIKAGAYSAMSEKEFLEKEIIAWKNSDARKLQVLGEKYYKGNHDILEKKRMVIGRDGELEEVFNIPNNKIVDNQYAKMVDQKANYLVGRPLTIKTEDADYSKSIKKIFSKRFMKMIKSVCVNCLNQGIGYIYSYYEDDGRLNFKVFSAHEILPFWNDDVERKDDVYITAVDESGKQEKYNWNRIPLIPFKYNDKEISLISKVKSLQDAINSIISEFQDNMQEDARNTILVLVNYDGQDLAEFRHNLSTYGVVKVASRDGGDGGDVKSLRVEVDHENYMAILTLLKRALVENGRGFDAKNEYMAGSPNQMYLKSMYSEIDLDANGMETEFSDSFEQLFWFVDHYLDHIGVGDFKDEAVEIVFNRDTIINTSILIDDINKSRGFVSDKTLLSKHPFVLDVEQELKGKG